MNYFAHGIRFLDRPLYLAGTAVPDWLSVADRRVRMRDKHLQPAIDSDDPVLAELAAGIRQHLEDDDWFHQSRAFYEVTSDVSDLFRAHLGPEDGFRPGFLGHIATELLLDRFLAEFAPESLQRYYDALESVRAADIQTAVNCIGPRTTQRLTGFIDAFRQVRFLFDYLQPDRMLTRLNQVMRRVKLNALPDSVAGVLERAFDVVRRRGWELLPPPHFTLDNKPPHNPILKEHP